MLFSAVLLEQEAEYMRRDEFALRRHVRLNPDVRVWEGCWGWSGGVGSAIGVGRGDGDTIQQVREPKQVVPVTDDPVEVDAAVVEWHLVVFTCSWFVGVMGWVLAMLILRDILLHRSARALRAMDS